MFIRLGPEALNDAYQYVCCGNGGYGYGEDFSGGLTRGECTMFSLRRLNEGIVDFALRCKVDGEEGERVKVASLRHGDPVQDTLMCTTGETPILPTLGGYLTNRLMVEYPGPRFPTVADVADRLGVHKSTMTRLLQDRNALSRDLAARLCKAFGFSWTGLFALAIQETGAAPPPMPAVSGLDERQHRLFSLGVDVGSE